MHSGTIKVFIVDDHYMVIEGIRSLLLQDKTIEWMGHAMHATSCLAFLQQQQPDVILMDINLPDVSGIELCREVKKKYPAVPVIALSSFNQLSFIQKMLESGASGYLLKNATQEELDDALTTVVDGRKYLSDDVAQIVKTSANSRVPVLTRREQEVLGLIAEGMTNHEIADKLFVSTTTVDSHRKNLLAKFEVKNTAILIRLAVKHGLL